MTKIELLEMLTKEAGKFVNDTSVLQRNQHLHNMDSGPSVRQAEAILICFINQVGMKQGVDFALHADDLKQ